MSTMRIPKAVVFCTVLLNTAAAAIDTVSGSDKQITMNNVPGTSAQLSRIASSPKPNWAERRNPRSPARKFYVSCFEIERRFEEYNDEETCHYPEVECETEGGKCQHNSPSDSF
ncbi:hypothetical protein QR680_007629 [Steinernema hermaphroditum]|uniref:EMI domain-containing protein n=1 Tax=Steinernema hermaphroditum TaxID=289476 RepID=A0AA39M696_9BILA|nr:hypothetical protein QR680_007629 [Steinernema hermaphroditum]